MNSLQKTLPPSTAESRGIREILLSCGEELEKLEEQARRACLQLDFSRVDENGLALWERELGLKPEPVWTAERRRERILAVLALQETCTPRRLLALLARLLEGEAELEEQFSAYRICPSVQVTRFLEPSMRRVEAVLRQAAPAHLEVLLSARTGVPGEPQIPRGLFQGMKLNLYSEEEESA